MKSRQKSKKIIKIIILLVIVLIIITLVLKNNNKINFKFTGGLKKKQEISTTMKEKNTNNFTYVTSRDGEQVPVPKGYTASSVENEQYVNVQKDTEGNKLYDGGFVIYEGTDAVPSDSNGLFNAQKTRNQWVWVPISNEQFSEIYHISGNEIYSNQYNFPTATDENDQTSKYNITVVTNNNEPRVAERRDFDYSLLQYLDEAPTLYQFKNELKQRYYDLLMSIQTYGGFYIGRYETGDLSKNVAVVKRLNNDLGNQNWYTMYQLCKRLKGNNEAVDTNLIYGSQYDEVLKWFIDTDALSLYQVVNDASSWGNFLDNSIPYMYNTNGDMSTTTLNGYGRKLIMSGASDYTRVNNIYDLCGNVHDWTMEWYAANTGRWVRGGNYGSKGSQAQVSTRAAQIGTTDKHQYTGCRATLFIK